MESFVLKDYETFKFEDGFNAEQALKEITALISDFRIQFIGVDKRDLESIKTQLNIYRSLNHNQANESEREMYKAKNIEINFNVFLF